MSKQTLKIPLNITQQLLHHAQSSPEMEVCGLVGSLNKTPVSCYPIKNANPSPENRFTLDSKEHIAAFKTMREKGEELFAIYHSHPHTAATPSASDISQANYPDALYLIISLSTKGILELRGFNIQQDKVQEVTLNLYS